jgi:hypothetical protein
MIFAGSQLHCQLKLIIKPELRGYRQTTAVARQVAHICGRPKNKAAR